MRTKLVAIVSALILAFATPAWAVGGTAQCGSSGRMYTSGKANGWQDHTVSITVHYYYQGVQTRRTYWGYRSGSVGWTVIGNELQWGSGYCVQ